MIRLPLSRRRVALLVAAGPVVMTSVLAIAWVRSGRIPAFGDEPHYLIMAESIGRDRDFELRNNYWLEARAPRFIGAIDPHTVQIGHRWYSIHGPALGILLAPSVQFGGVMAARVTTCVLAGAFSWALFLWLDWLVGRQSAVWLSLSAVLSVPYVFGSVHLYPDAVAGALVAGLVFWLHRATERPGGPAGWIGFWLVTGMLPALMVKFVAPAAVLTSFAFMMAATGRRRRRDLHALLASSPLVLVGSLLLLAYHKSAFGTLLGVRGSGELTQDLRQATTIFLGLHFDQAQGMFLQHPLLLAGVPALGILAIRAPRLAAAWCALYASLIIPNALQVIPYGGASPSGRFGWPAAWLWLVPLGIESRRHGFVCRRLLRPLAVASLGYQAVLAVRWLPAPMSITTLFDPRLAIRNSLFPVPLRGWLPSFYSVDFLSHPPNIVAIVLASVLMMSGPVAWWWHARHVGVTRDGASACEDRPDSSRGNGS